MGVCFSVVLILWYFVTFVVVLKDVDIDHNTNRISNFEKAYFAGQCVIALILFIFLLCEANKDINSIEDNFNSEFESLFKKYDKDASSKDYIDAFQEKYYCCGVKSKYDYENRTNLWPKSCCHHLSEICTKSPYFKTIDNRTQKVTYEFTRYFIYYFEGCTKVFAEIYDCYSRTVRVYLISIFCVQIFTIICVGWMIYVLSIDDKEV